MSALITIDRIALMPEAVATNHVDAAADDEPHRGLTLPNVKDGVSGLERLIRATGETPGGLDLGDAERRKHLAAAVLK